MEVENGCGGGGDDGVEGGEEDLSEDRGRGCFVGDCVGVDSGV